MATLFTSFGLPLAMGALVLGVLLLKGDRRTAISGPLTGFGGAWLLWTRLQDQSATTTDAVGGWVVAFGLLPFVIGLALVAPLVADAFRGRAAGRRSG
jgi:hypothetical protein